MKQQDYIASYDACKTFVVMKEEIMMEKDLQKPYRSAILSHQRRTKEKERKATKAQLVDLLSKCPRKCIIQICIIKAA